MKTLIAALVLLASPVAAQTAQCGPYDLVVAGLAERYGENRRVAGMMGPEQLFEVYANDETGTWTAITVGQDGQACLRASGNNFSDTDAEPPANL